MPVPILWKSYMVLAIILLSVAQQTCKKQQLAALPACIQQKIDSIRKEPRWNPPAEVREYLYRGIRVYYFSSNCCDQYNTVYDENCGYIGAPSGGFTGRGDGKCPGFTDSAKQIRLVWRDDR
ncbi:MAG: DUF6970 domain-containing protein [Flavisolibacter sp.]